VEINQIRGILLALEACPTLPQLRSRAPLRLPLQTSDRALQLCELRRPVVHRFDQHVAFPSPTNLTVSKRQTLRQGKPLRTTPRNASHLGLSCADSIEKGLAAAASAHRLRRTSREFDSDPSFHQSPLRSSVLYIHAIVLAL
jgi:hypothetical protein